MKDHAEDAKSRPFHHPDISLPVIRRRAAEALLDLMVDTAAVLATRGRYLLWRSSCSSDTAYRSAVYRLRKAGLVAYRRRGGGAPVLELTDEGEARASDVCRRGPPWPKRWSGFWYVLVYDVPEAERSYRVALRGFLKRMRMGCLQKSVWVTHRDIRPEYDDLVKAAAADDYAFLFESRTVLGRGPQAVVRAAWNMGRLEAAQRWYCEVCQDRLDRVCSGKVAKDELVALASDEMNAYLAVMSEDPLLPRDLWPEGYQGETAWKLHRRMRREIARRL